MKNSIFIFLLTLSGLCGRTQTGLQQISFNDINGNTTVALSDTAHKTLFIILPGVNVDTAIVNQLQRFEQTYGSTTRIIGVLSREDGYHDADLDSVKSIYQSLMQSGLILTEGLYTHKSSDTLQAPLLQWLTNKSSNQYSDMDVSGIGEKFLVNGTGGLYTVLGGDVSLDGELIASTLSN